MEDYPGDSSSTDWARDHKISETECLAVIPDGFSQADFE